mmetsp:Transcript_6800/g.16755  ORF Transcript_6800/g.16755 Transcript_6800/m.16755 type:complete len:149 (+) Transcript_6800:59-505(+)
MHLMQTNNVRPLSLLTPHQRHGKPISTSALYNDEFNDEVTKQYRGTHHHLILGHQSYPANEETWCGSQAGNQSHITSAQGDPSVTPTFHHLQCGSSLHWEEEMEIFEALKKKEINHLNRQYRQEPHDNPFLITPPPLPLKHKGHLHNG